MKQTLISPLNSKPIGPYSHAAIAQGTTVYVSGQIALQPDGTLVQGSVGDQTRQALTNLANVLQTAGSGLEHVVKTTVYLRDMSAFAEMNAVYAEFFTQEFPARTTIAVVGLPMNVDVEIDAIALLP